MSFKFEELEPIKTLTSTTVAPLTGVSVLDLTHVRAGYEFNPLTEAELAPNYRILLADAETGEEVNIWLRFPEGLANPNLNQGVMKTHMRKWVERLRESASTESGTRLIFAQSGKSDNLFGLDFFLKGQNRVPLTSDDHADAIMDKLMLHVGKKKTRRSASVECYESAPGRRYRIEAEIGHGFTFKANTLAGADTPFRNSLYGTTMIRDAIYQFEIFHDVLREQLPLYYGSKELERIVLTHLNHYIGDFTGALSVTDLVLNFTGVAK